MGFWRATDQSDYVTLYRGENIHPAIEPIFEWADEHVWYYMHNADENVFLAGGAIRSFFEKKAPRDYDIYFGDVGTLNEIRNNLTAASFKKILLKNTNDSDIYRLTAVLRDGRVADHTFNLVTRNFFDTPQEVLDTFDFRVCMAGLSKEAFVYHPEFFTDLAAKTLVVNNIDDPLATMWRMQKYTRKGYTIPMEEAWRVAEAIHNLPSLPKIELKKGKVEPDAVPLSSVFRSS